MLVARLPTNPEITVQDAAASFVSLKADVFVRTKPGISSEKHSVEGFYKSMICRNVHCQHF